MKAHGRPQNSGWARLPTLNIVFWPRPHELAHFGPWCKMHESAAPLYKSKLLCTYLMINEVCWESHCKNKVKQLYLLFSSCCMDGYGCIPLIGFQSCCPCIQKSFDSTVNCFLLFHYFESTFKCEVRIQQGWLTAVSLEKLCRRLQVQKAVP